MRLSHYTKIALRKFERSLYNPEHRYTDRLYAFYLLLLPVVEWVKPAYLELGLSKYEVESEAFLLIDKVFRNYKKEKSSIVPYVERSIDWYLKNEIRRLRKTSVEDPSGLMDDECGVYEIEEDYYWNHNKILFEDQYVGKCFTKGQKYLIYRIINSDCARLSNRDLAQDIEISKGTVRLLLNDLKEILLTGGYRK